MLGGGKELCARNIAFAVAEWHVLTAQIIESATLVISDLPYFPCCPTTRGNSLDETAYRGLPWLCEASRTSAAAPLSADRIAAGYPNLDAPWSVYSIAAETPDSAGAPRRILPRCATQSCQAR
ncbi:hypothetical protein D9M72_590490 [compost metagenome]